MTQKYFQYGSIQYGSIQYGSIQYGSIHRVLTKYSSIIPLTLFSLLAFFFPINVSANPDKVPHPMSAQAIYEQQCSACHGENAQGKPSLNAPVLAGQYAWYLQRQLNHFANNLRGVHADDEQGKPMVAIAKQFSVQISSKTSSKASSKASLNESVNVSEGSEFSVLAAYIESLSSSSSSDSSFAPISASSSIKSNEEKNRNKIKNGSRYYQAKCGACHGGAAQGNTTFNAPKLSGQNSDYLKLQMNNFVKGIRGNSKKDKFGRQMAMMAKTTKGKELADILFFISLQE